MGATPCSLSFLSLAAGEELRYSKLLALFALTNLVAIPYKIWDVVNGNASIVGVSW